MSQKPSVAQSHHIVPWVLTADRGAAFRHLGVAYELSPRELEAALEGRPAGIDPAALASAWVVVFNEFKVVKSELKQLEREITFAPKHQLSTTVPIFAKLFLSAEDVNALTGSGVEDQFASRFSYLRAPEDACGVEEHPLFMKLGAAGYLTALVAFIGGRLTNRLVHYKTLGYAEALRAAERDLAAFHAQHGITRHFEALADTLPAVATDFAEWVRVGTHWPHQVRAKVENGEGELVFVKHAAGAFDAWLKATGADAARSRTLGHRRGDILRLASAEGRGIVLRRLPGVGRDGAAVKALLIASGAPAAPGNVTSILDRLKPE